MSGPYERGDWDSQGGWSDEAERERGRESWADASGGPGRGYGSGYGQGSHEREGYGRDPYGRPPSSSGRRYGADDPTRPSSDWGMGGGGYGRPGPSSGGGYGYPEQSGGDTWGDYTRSNTHWRGGSGPMGYRNLQQGAAGPNSLPRKQYGVPWEPAQRWDMTPALPKKKSRRTLWVTLGVIAAVLVLTCSGIGFLAAQYLAPDFQVGLFCGSLQGQQYATAYTMLSSDLRDTLSSNDFVTDGQTLDAIEGRAQSCGSGSAATGSYTYTLGASTARVTVSIRRATAGILRGDIHLKNENGWKIDGLDASLLGVSLGALQAANAYCAALQGASYTAAYAVLGKSLTAHTTAAQYAQDGAWHDTLDGPVSVCAVTALGTPTSETDTAASLTVSITRGKLGAKKDTLTLDVEGGAWKVSALGPGLVGTDLGALDTAARFCADLKSANYNDAYGLFSDSFKSGSTEADFASVFSGNYNGFKWVDCTPTISSFKLSGDHATLAATLKVADLSTNQTRNGPVTFSFARNNGVWQLDNVQAQ